MKYSATLITAAILALDVTAAPLRRDLLDVATGTGLGVVADIETPLGSLVDIHARAVDAADLSSGVSTLTSDVTEALQGVRVGADLPVASLTVSGRSVGDDLNDVVAGVTDDVGELASGVTDVALDAETGASDLVLGVTKAVVGVEGDLVGAVRSLDLDLDTPVATAALAARDLLDLGLDVLDTPVAAADVDVKRQLLDLGLDILDAPVVTADVNDKRQLLDLGLDVLDAPVVAADVGVKRQLLDLDLDVLDTPIAAADVDVKRQILDIGLDTPIAAADVDVKRQLLDAALDTPVATAAIDL